MPNICILMGHLQLLSRLIQSFISQSTCSALQPSPSCSVLASKWQEESATRVLVQPSGEGQRHGATHNEVVFRPSWDVGTWWVIVFNFSISDCSVIKLCLRRCVKSCFFIQNGRWSSVYNPNWGEVGRTGFLGGSGHSSKVVTD